MHVILWEFRAKKGREKEFEKVYGAGGDWARFFGSAKGYLGTELGTDIREAGRFVTLDRWTSREAFEEFRRNTLSQYEALDKRCEELTEHETHLGSFQVAESGDP